MGKTPYIAKIVRVSQKNLQIAKNPPFQGVFPGGHAVYCGKWVITAQYHHSPNDDNRVLKTRRLPHPGYNMGKPCSTCRRDRTMQTRTIKVDPTLPDPAAIRAAADTLLRGGLVAFPTETVYGLGALALQADAVARIFAAKGRPATNPIIVHVAEIEAARLLVADWPSVATRLAERFWPGPLTMVLPKAASVLEIVTAGGTTVALRAPGHPVALALLREVGAPLAAPSANLSEGVSATRAEHVLKSLAGRIDLVLDAGPASGGLESTVLDVTVDPPRLLRPGLVSAEELEQFLGALSASTAEGGGAAVKRSPGMLSRHYAPKAHLTLVDDDEEGARLAMRWAEAGERVGWLARGAGGDSPRIVRRAMPSDAAAFGATLYHALHELDASDVERIIVTRPPEGGAWQAIHDRLARAQSWESREIRR
jgi:L-threonylcarbamoyladenylate synthase